MSPLLYRVFLIPLTVFFINLAMPAAHAQGDALLVKGVTVDVSAESALSARNKAFIEARRKAYQQLAAQTVPAADLPGLTIPDDDVLASMVRDFEIVNEKMTSRRYAGTIDVRFNPAVRNSFQTVSVQPTTPALPIPDTTLSSDVTGARIPVITGADDVYSPARSNVMSNTQTVPVNIPAIVPQAAAPRPTLVLPWYGVRGRQTLWGQDNPWRTAWEANANLSRDKSMPVLLPVGDVDDLRDYAPPQPLSQRGDINALMKRYNASDAVLALAEPAEGGAIIVSLYRFESGTPVAMGRFGVDAGAGDDSMKQAVERALVSLRAMPGSSMPGTTQASVMTAPVPSAAIAAPQMSGGMQFVTLAHFSGLQQWVNMRNALMTTPGISGVDVQSISPSQAQVRFQYSGDNGSLGALLAQKGLQLAPASNGMISSVAGGASPQYLLTALRSY